MDRCDWTQIPDDFLVVQGQTTAENMDEEHILSFFALIACVLQMKPLGHPYMIHGLAELPNGDMSPGYCAFMPWVTSGCALYSWEDVGKLVVVIHSCKQFNHRQAQETVIQHFELSEYNIGKLEFNKNYYGKTTRQMFD